MQEIQNEIDRVNNWLERKVNFIKKEERDQADEEN